MDATNNALASSITANGPHGTPTGADSTDQYGRQRPAQSRD